MKCWYPVVRIRSLIRHGSMNGFDVATRKENFYLAFDNLSMEKSVGYEH